LKDQHNPMNGRSWIWPDLGTQIRP